LQIGKAQVADNPGRFVHATGEMNYDQIAKALYKMGYLGPIGLGSFAR
jgi:hydroxypyruvate isomerase